MKRTRLGAFGLAALLILARDAAAQEVLKPFRADDDKPVMRATPVKPPKQMLADPVDSGSAPSATPVPVLKATAVKKPKGGKSSPAPQPPRTTPPPTAPEPSDPGEIRISPQGTSKPAEQVQLDVADSYYARRSYDMAAPEYQRYIDQYPAATDMPTAYFRLAESYRHTGAINAAKVAYEMLLDRYQAGDFVGPAAYRLAELYYADKNYPMALPLYRRASARLKEPAVVNAAKFFMARCLEATDSKLEARSIYEELAEIKESNPLQDASRLSYALLLKEAGSSSGLAEALKQVQLLMRQTTNSDLQAEAAVHAGLWEIESGQAEKGAADLKKALDLPGIGRWREAVQVGLVRMYYDTGKYKQVLDACAEQTPVLSAEARPELLVLAGDANRQLGKFPEALALYDQVMKDFGNTPFAKEAGYQRLACLYNAGDAKLGAAIDAYLATGPEPAKRDQSLLMKAEWLYKKQDYKGAAPIYDLIGKSSELNGTLKAEALFKFGWCCMQIRDFERAVKSFTQFIDDYPTNKTLPYALIQRAIAYQAQKNLPAAEKDFDTIIRRHPAATKERELALQQRALIHGEQGDNAGMAESFEQLLKEYPQTGAAAQANYWIGYTAYDAKEYKKAAEHLSKAREEDKDQFFERGAIRIILSYYYLEDRERVAREVDAYVQGGGKTNVPPEVLRWLVEQDEKAGQFVEEEKYLVSLCARDEAQPKDFLTLGNTRLKLDLFAQADEALKKYLDRVREPLTRALGLISYAKAQIGEKDFDGAQNSINEALTLQPEGKLSGEARIVAGDVQMARGNTEEAAKLYMSVAIIIDEETVTPHALEKAVEAWKKTPGHETDAKKTLNTLQSRYPEYFQETKLRK